MSLPGPPSKVWLPTSRCRPVSGVPVEEATGPRLAPTIVSSPAPASTNSTDAGTTIRSAHGVPTISSPLLSGPAAQLGAGGELAAVAPAVTGRLRSRRKAAARVAG